MVFFTLSGVFTAVSCSFTPSIIHAIELAIAESHTNCRESFCWDCHELLACFVLLNSFKERTTVQSYCWNLHLFAFKELGSAVVFSLLNLLFGDKGRSSYQFLRAVSMSSPLQIRLEKSVAIYCSCMCT